MSVAPAATLLRVRPIATAGAALGATLLRSQLHEVSDAPWTRLVHALTIADDPRDPSCGGPRPFDARTPAGGYGCFDFRPQRLADLGLMRRVRVDNASGRCFFVGEFIPPMTEEGFLQRHGAPFVQYDALTDSLRRYDRRLEGVQLPPGMTRSGALALHHRLGPCALPKWARHQEPTTRALYRRANGLF